MDQITIKANKQILITLLDAASDYISETGDYGDFSEDELFAELENIGKQLE